MNIYRPSDNCFRDSMMRAFDMENRGCPDRERCCELRCERCHCLRNERFGDMRNIGDLRDERYYDNRDERYRCHCKRCRCTCEICRCNCHDDRYRNR